MHKVITKLQKKKKLERSEKKVAFFSFIAAWPSKLTIDSGY